jgi:2'-5' RNA ligase
MTKRLFLAINLTREIIKKLSVYSRDIDNLKVTWVSSDNLHVTVLFLGNTEESSIKNLIELIERQVKDIKKFILNFKCVTFFPHTYNPRMIWAEFYKDKNFDALVKNLYTTLAPVCKNISVQDSCENIIPHVTLARLKAPPRTQVFFKQPDIKDLYVVSIDLMSSKLLPDGPEYTLLKKFCLDLS